MRLAQRPAPASAQASDSPAADLNQTPAPKTGRGFSLWRGKAMKLTLILISFLATTTAFAGSLPTVGPVPTAAGAGVSTHASGAARDHQHPHAFHLDVGGRGKPYCECFRQFSRRDTWLWPGACSCGCADSSKRCVWYGGGGGSRGGQPKPWRNHQAIGILPRSSPTLARSRRSLSRSAARR